MIEDNSLDVLAVVESVIASTSTVLSSALGRAPQLLAWPVITAEFASLLGRICIHVSSVQFI